MPKQKSWDIPGQVPIPKAPRYRENEARVRGDDQPCVVCGKAVKADTNPLMVRLGPTCDDFAIPMDTPDQGGAEMGCYPIGPDCAKKHPEIAKLARRFG